MALWARRRAHKSSVYRKDARRRKAARGERAGTAFDIVPTMLELANISLAHVQFGKSLVPQLKGAPGDRIGSCTAKEGIPLLNHATSKAILPSEEWSSLETYTTQN